MIDLFTIFSKGGIVLWCFQSTQQMLTPSVNSLIKTVFLQERSDAKTVYSHESLTLKFAMDNEYELVFVVAYQSIVQLSYVDKLLTDVQLAFRDRYKNLLEDRYSVYFCQGKRDSFLNFADVFTKLLQNAEQSCKIAASVKMKTFEQSGKSQKTVASMIQQPAGAKSNTTASEDKKMLQEKNQLQVKPGCPGSVKQIVANEINGHTNNDVIQKNREAFFNKMNKPTAIPAKQIKPPSKPEKKVKQARIWDGSSGNAAQLDFSSANAASEAIGSTGVLEDKTYVNRQDVGSMKGDLRDIETGSSSDESGDEEIDENAPEQKQKQATGSRFGLLSAFKNLVGSKKLSSADIAPVLEKMREHLISKNVAAEIADKLCNSVAAKLEGKVIGTFSGVTSTVKETLREALVQLLSPQRRVNILRDVIEARKEKRPYSIVFCGVNGVGKSTNLAKITFWLAENGCKVLIAACDTFRAGAVEQLRTHTRHLNALHPDSVALYEQGYGKDAAGIAARAISHAAENSFDVVLVDTAGRMQDNEPLMRALSKLIRVNEPDLVLFVGEALVGNEAVDQLVKFNQALTDNSAIGSSARLIDGIVLTKFDTIDDKVGAAISMTYITGQPIVFVGTGQTYKELKNLNANAVVHALLK